MTKIKLCGLMRPEDAEAANELKPDFAGLVFWERSRRFVDQDQAKLLRQILDPSIPVVGVFVDQPMDRILELLDQDILQMAQLHGHESEEELNYLKVRSGRPVIRAVKVRSEKDLLFARHSAADYILLDNGTGTGETFDWTLMDDRLARPIFLAGGLNEENVKDAICRYRPYAVDVSSGIETEGRKDPEKMKRFVRAVREADEKCRRIQR